VIPSSNQVVAGTHTIAVSNPTPGGGNSTGTSFQINNLVPVLSSISPSTVAVASSPVQVVLSGMNFVPSTTVSINSTAVAATFISSNQIAVTVPVANLSTEATLSVSVVNPSPGGGNSNSFSLPVTNTPSTDTEYSPKDSGIGIDAGSVAYIIGSAAGTSSNSSSSAEESPSLKKAGTTIAAEATSNASGWCSFAYSGAASSSSGTCVGHVPWMFQMAPGTFPDDAIVTANCGTSSYLMVRSYYENNQSNSSCQQNVSNCFDYPQWNDTSNGNNCTLSAQHITNLLQNIDPNPTSVTCNPAPSTPSLENTPFTVTQECNYDDSTLHYTMKNKVMYADSSCLYYEGNDSTEAYYGPRGVGFSINTLANIAANEGFTKTQPAYATADSSGLSKINNELANGYPVIVLVRYKMRELRKSSQGDACYLDGTLFSTNTKKCGGHYMVVVGMDSAANGNVYVNDPFPGSPETTPWPGEYITYTKANFLASWGSSSSAYLVLRPSSAKPPVSLVANSVQFTQAQVNTPYNVTIAASFGTTPYSFSTKTTDGSSGTGLPPGLAIDSSSGTISGTPTTAGIYSFYLQVADATAAAANTLVSITVGATAPSVTITTPPNLPPGFTGATYQYSLTASGGQAPYTWSITTSSSTLPTSISLTAAGALTGTPAQAGDYSFTVQVTDKTGTIASQAFSMTVFAVEVPVQITSLTANPYTVNASGTSSLLCTSHYLGSGSVGYAWTASGGTVSGTLSNAAWAAPSQAGSYTVTCSVSDSDGGKDSRSVVLTVLASGLTATISPTSGVSGSTKFAISGSGATDNGGVTATITAPNSETSTLHVTANSQGQFTFATFSESTSGVYSAITADDKSGAKSNVLTWTVSGAQSTPTVTSVSPTSMTADGLQHTLTINGTNFQSGDYVQFEWTVPPNNGTWNTGGALTVVSSTQITVSMNPGTVTDTISVRVCNSAGTCTSGSQSVAVTAASLAPVVALISPSTMTADSQQHTLTINGSYFTSSNVVQVEFTGSNGWKNANGNPPAFVNSGQMTISINPGLSNDTIYVRVCRSSSQETASDCSSGTQSIAVTTGTPVATTVLGIDVAEMQGTIDWSQVASSGGKAFAFIRATAGINTTDSQFSKNVVTAKQAGLLVSAYHFAYPQYFTAHEEAQKFLSVAGNYIGAGYLPPALDIEDSPDEDSYPYEMGDTTLSQWITDWCTEVQQTSGVAPIVYSTRYYARNYFLSSVAAFSYWVVTNSGSPSSDPGGMGIWSTWLFQQYLYGGSGGTSAGVTGAVDLDSFNGNLTALTALTTRNTTVQTPTVTSISPTSMTADGAQHTLTIYGTNFQSGDYVQFKWTQGSGAGAWNAGSTPSISSSTQMTVSMNPGTVTDTISVRVCNSGGTCTSGSQSVAVTAAVLTPTVTSISPTTMTADGAQHTLTIYGSNFQSGDYVQFKWTQGSGAGAWNTGNTPSIASATQMTVSMNPGTVTDTISVRVCNSTGTCTSGSQSVAVTAAVLTPTVTSISPTSMAASSGSQTLTIYGSNFASGNEVQVEYTGSNGWINSPYNPPTVVNSGQMTTTFNPGTTADTIYVRVCESASQETTSTCSSGTQAVTVTAAVPSVSSISPTSMTADGAQHTLTIYGSNFQSGDYVQFKWTQGSGAGAWNTGNTPSIVSSTQMTVSMNPGTVTDTISVRVCNSAGTCTSGSQSVAVTATVLTPTVTSISPTSMTADGAQHTLTIYGTNFQSGDYVQFYWTQGSGSYTWNTGNTPSIASSTQMTVSMNPGKVTDTISVRVCSSAGTCTSGSLSVAVH
jgi:GH25 family lysozyme M1 (1,4-beta-N-acetylmuramidase)